MSQGTQFITILAQHFVNKGEGNQIISMLTPMFLIFHIFPRLKKTNQLYRQLKNWVTTKKVELDW